MDAYDSPYESREAFDVTDKNVEEILQFMYDNDMNAHEFNIEYADCGPHRVILVRDDTESA